VKFDERKCLNFFSTYWVIMKIMLIILKFNLTKVYIILIKFHAGFREYVKIAKLNPKVA